MKVTFVLTTMVMKVTAVSKIFSNNQTDLMPLGNQEGIGVAYFDLSGAVIKSNKLFKELIETPEISQTDHQFKNLFQLNFDTKSATNMFWYKVLDGLPQATEVSILIKGQLKMLKVFLTSVTNAQSYVSGIVGFFAKPETPFESKCLTSKSIIISDPLKDFGLMPHRFTKILLVKDYNRHHVLLKESLGKIGFEFVSIACSINDSLDKCRIIKPDIVFTDYELENGEDGIELAIALEKSQVKSIVFTSVLFDELQISTIQSKLSDQKLNQLIDFIKSHKQ